jgi:hypothetical protein
VFTKAIYWVLSVIQLVEVVVDILKCLSVEISSLMLNLSLGLWDFFGSSLLLRCGTGMPSLAWIWEAASQLDISDCLTERIERLD